MKKKKLLAKALVISLLATSMPYLGVPLKVKASANYANFSNASLSDATSERKDNFSSQNNNLDYHEALDNTYNTKLPDNLQNTSILKLADTKQISHAKILYEGKSNDLTWSIDENGKLLVEGTGDYESNYRGAPPWEKYSWDIITAEINITGITNISSMFFDCVNLTNLDLSKLDTSNVTNMSSMFSNCSELISLDLSSFDTSNVTNMGSMFSNCSKLISLDLSNFNTTNVIDMGYMFYECSSLTQLDLSNFDISKLTNTHSMFWSCTNLIELDLSSFSRNSITDMHLMFAYCPKLETLNLSNLDTSFATNMGYMFAGCENLKSLDLNSFNTSNVNTMEQMFSNCSSLTNLDLSNFNTSNVKDMAFMFNFCTNLENLKLDGFDTSNVKIMDGMFQGCSNLTSLDLSNFDISHVSQMAWIFDYCENLKIIYTPKNLSSSSTNLPEVSSDSDDNKWYMPDGTEVKELPVNLGYSVKLTKGSVSKEDKFPEIIRFNPKSGDSIYPLNLEDYYPKDKKTELTISFALNGKYSISDGIRFCLKEYDTDKIIAYAKSVISTDYGDEEISTKEISIKFDPILPKDTKMYLAIEDGKLINNKTGETFIQLCKKNNWWFKTPNLLEGVWGFTNYESHIDLRTYNWVYNPAEAFILWTFFNGDDGLCAGLTSSLMNFTSDFKISDFVKEGTNIFTIEDIPIDAYIKPLKTMDVDHFIKLSYILQFLPVVEKQRKNNSSQKNLNNLKRLCDSIEKGSVFIIVEGNYNKEKVIHALWGYKVEKFDDKTEIIVYDCNNGNSINRLELTGKYPNFTGVKYLSGPIEYTEISFIENYPSAYLYALKNISRAINNYLVATNIEDFGVTDSLGNIISKEQIYSSEQDIIIPITVASTSENSNKENSKTDMYWIQPDSILEATNTANESKELAFASNTQIIEMDVPVSDTIKLSANNTNETMDMQLKHNNDSEVMISYSHVTDDDITKLQISGNVQDTAIINGKNNSADIDGIDVNTVIATYNDQKIEKKLDVPAGTKMNISVIQATDDTYLKVTYDADNDGVNDTDLVDPIPFNPSESKPDTIPVISFDVQSPEGKIIVGSTVQLVADIKPENATDKTVTWISSDESIAKVSASGLVTALKAGEVKITAKLANGSFEKTITIEIQNKPEESKPSNNGNTSGSGSSSGGSSSGGSSSGSSRRRRSSSSSELSSNRIVIDSKKGHVDTLTGIITGSGAEYCTWLQDMTGWKLFYADGTYAAGTNITDSAGGTYEQVLWEKVNGAWYAFGTDGYAKSGFVYDYMLLGWFYIDINTGMLTGWQCIDDKWYYFNPISDGAKGKMYVDTWVDNYYVNPSGVWEENH